MDHAASNTWLAGHDASIQNLWYAYMLKWALLSCADHASDTSTKSMLPMSTSSPGIGSIEMQGCLCLLLCMFGAFPSWPDGVFDSKLVANNFWLGAEGRPWVCWNSTALWRVSSFCMAAVFALAAFVINPSFGDWLWGLTFSPFAQEISCNTRMWISHNYFRFWASQPRFPCIFQPWNLIQVTVFGVWLTLQVGLMVCMSDYSFKKHNNPIYICEWQSKRFSCRVGAVA